MPARVVRAQVSAVQAAPARVHRAEVAVGSGLARVHRAQVSASGVLTSSAGVDQSVDGLTVVQLNGSGSSGSPTRWTWTQTAGPAVTLLDADTATPSFVAPGTTGGATLSFQLVVGSGASSAAPDTVSVTVFPHVEWRNLAGAWVPVRTDLITSAPTPDPLVVAGGRASPLLTAAPPVVGAGGVNVVVVAYRDSGPRRLSGTVADLSEGANLAAVGEDLVVLLPGRGVNLNTSPPTYGPVSQFTAGPGVYLNTLQATPLRRKHGMQVKSAGRHVVVIGGQVDVSTDYSGSVGELPGVSPDFGLSKANRALYLIDATGTVHLEGILLTGTYQFEAFNYNCNPSSTLVWQNMKGEASTGADGEIAGVRYLPIPNAAPGSGDHDGGDWFQFNRTPRVLIVDGSHSESNWFQEFFMKVEAGNTRMDSARIDNVASWDYQGPGAWLYNMPDPNGALCPDFRVGPNVGMQPGRMRHPDAAGTTAIQYPDTFTSLTNNAYPKTGQVSGFSATDGTYLENSAYLTLTGAPGGRVELIPTGTPIDPARALSIAGSGAGPGPGYVSPGYLAP